MTHAKPHSKGVNENHLKKYRDKIENLEDTIVKYRIVLNRYKGNGWTNNLFWCLVGMSLWLWFKLVVSFF